MIKRITGIVMPEELTVNYTEEVYDPNCKVDYPGLLFDMISKS